jgi:cyclase
MNRKSFLQTGLFTVGAVALANQRLLAGLLQQPLWKITMLSDQVGIFTERGGTIAFYIYKDGIIVVDAQWPEQSKHLIDELSSKNNQPFELLINTHHHVPHTAGNISFKGKVKHVLAHENSKANQMKNAKLMKEENRQLYPDITYKETWCEKFGKENICLYHFGAAHTNGDSIIHFEHADIAHVGDLVFNRRHAGIDRSGGASVKNWIEVLKKIYTDFGRRTKFVFGFAGEGQKLIGTKDDVKAFSNYLQLVTLFVETEIKRGKPKKDIIKAKGIPGAPDWKGEGLDRTLSAMYDELTNIEAL